jgi:trans-aconitate 2-methyltransferase
MWDPGQYRHFGGERSRAFYELINQIGATEPRYVVDLGCGPGELTAELCRRWPSADVLGVDSSAEMISAAGEVLAGLLAGGGQASDGPASDGSVVAESAAGSAAGHQAMPRLRFELQDARDWQPDRPVDVLVSNALLQWIPGHEKLLVRWVRQLAEGGWLAFQVPGNYDQPSHLALRELAACARWRPLLADVALNRQAADPAEYLDLLATEGCEVNTWETTYLHVLSGPDPVLRWYQGTGLRPVLAALDQGQAAEFMAEYGALMRQAYPQAAYGTILPFRRVFVVASRRLA